MLYDLIILGGGPAGAAGAVYAARKRLKTLLIAQTFGGQSTDSFGIKNWIGTKEIAGADLAIALREHVMEYKGEFLDVAEGERVTKLEQKGPFHFMVTTESGKSYESKTVLITTGSGRRKLPAKNAELFEHKGLTYCASCDGPIFADQDVAVIGGGNAALETAAQLLAYCKSVTLLHRSDTFKADKITVDAVLANPKMKALTGVEILEVTGDKFANGIIYKTKEGTTETLPVTGIFVEIGQIPNTGFAEGLVTLDANKKIVTDPMTQKTSVLGIWAAGDATNGLYHQNNIAAGDAVKALENLYLELKTK